MEEKGQRLFLLLHESVRFLVHNHHLQPLPGENVVLVGYVPKKIEEKSFGNAVTNT